MLDITKLENADDYNFEADKAYYEMLKEGEYEKVLDIVAKHKDYSFRNAMLIHLQRPSAKICLTEPRWREIGKGIKKGANAIVIYKQIYDPYQDKGDKNANGKGVEILPSGIYQKAYIYDLKDTFGESIKRDYTYKDIENHFEAVKDGFKACCKDYNFEYVDTMSVEGTGIIDKKEKKVFIKNSLDKKSLFFTLVQSTAAALSRTADRRVIPCVTQEQMRNIAKYEAAAVNYIVCKRFNVEPPKLTNPKLNEKDSKTVKAFMLNLAYVRKIANRITEKIIYAINYEVEHTKKSTIKLETEKEEDVKTIHDVKKENSNDENKFPLDPPNKEETIGPKEIEEKDSKNKGHEKE